MVSCYNGEMLGCYYLLLTSVLSLSRYPKFRTYVERLYNRRQCWALCFRDGMMVRNNHTNNYSEAAMRVIKVGYWVFVWGMSLYVSVCFGTHFTMTNHH